MKRGKATPNIHGMEGEIRVLPLIWCDGGPLLKNARSKIEKEFDVNHIARKYAALYDEMCIVR